MTRKPYRLNVILLGSVALAAIAVSSGLSAAPLPPPPAPLLVDGAPPPASPLQITGVKTYDPITIGQNNPDQSVNISGFVTTLGGMTIGQNETSSRNQVTVGGGGYLMNSDFSVPIIVGDKGSENLLAITGGGLFALEVIAGNAAGADANSIVVEAGSEVSMSGLYLGMSGSYNQLSVASGGYLINSLAILGSSAGSNFNAAVIGADSRWFINSSVGTLVIGLSGDDNQVEVRDGGLLSLTGVNGDPSANVMLGALGGDRNSLFIGYSGSATHPGDIYIGENGSDNQLSLYFSGALTSGGNAYIGGGPDYSAAAFGVPREIADNNRVVVDGLATTWSIGKSLHVGAGRGPGSSGNQLSVQYGGQVSADAGVFIGYDATSGGNLVSVFGVDAADIPNPSLLQTADIRIGLSGDDVEASESFGNMLMAGSTDPGSYGGTVNATRILVGNDNTLGLGGAGLLNTGDLAFGSSSSYLVHIDSTARGSLAASGTASLNGTVRMSFGQEFDNRFVILTSNLTDGAFAGLDTSTLAPGLSAQLETVPLDTGTEVAITFVSAFAQNPGLDANQLEVATSIDQAFNSGSSIPGELAVAPPADPQPVAAQASPTLMAAPLEKPLPKGVTRELLRERLSSLTGEVGAGGGTDAVRQASTSFLSLLTGGHSGLPRQESGQGASIWGSAFGTSGTIEGDSATGSHDTATHVLGIASGWDYSPAAGQAVGVSIAAGNTGWSLSDDLGTGQSTFLQLGAYGGMEFGDAYLTAAGGLALHAMSTRRHVSILRSHRYEADFGAADAALRLEGGYRLSAAPGVGLTPYIAVEGQHIHTGSHDEDTASGSDVFGLSYESSSENSMRSELGAQFDIAPELGTARLALSLSAAWAHDWTERDGGEASFQSIDNASFAITAADTPDDLLLVGANLRARATETLDVSGRFTGEFGSGYQNLTGGIAINHPF